MVAIQGTINGRRWNLAACLVALVHNADTFAPNRNRASDGTIGDAAHQARPSDHNPDWSTGGIVRALDLGHDPANGFDTWKIANVIASSIVYGAERRVNYLISGDPARRGDLIFHIHNGRWQWDPHPHTANSHNSHHLHVSCTHDAQLAASVAPWTLTTLPPKPAPTLLLEDEMDIIKTKTNGPAVTNWITKKPIGPKTLAAFQDAQVAKNGKVAPLVEVDQAVYDSITNS
jgi:hypothetical protein